MSESYLVIGGSGFLGQRIVHLLLARGERRVAIFDKASVNCDQEVRVFLGDITDRSAVETAVKESAASCIFHTASVLPGPPRSVHMKINVSGTENIISVAVAQGVAKLVYTSTASVVFAGVDQANVDETAPYPTKPLDDYNESKALAEQAVLEANGRGGLTTASLRVAGLFGPGDKLAVPTTLSMIAKGRTGMQIGNNTNLFDFTYIDNAALAHLLAAERLSPAHSKFSKVAGQAFFITNGDPWPYWNFPRALWKAAGHTPARTFVLPRGVAMVIAAIMELYGWLTGIKPDLTRFIVVYLCTTRWCNIDKARQCLDYDPPISMEEGIKRAVEYWQKYQAPRARD